MNGMISRHCGREGGSEHVYQCAHRLPIDNSDKAAHRPVVGPAGIGHNNCTTNAAASFAGRALLISHYTLDSDCAFRAQSAPTPAGKLSETDPIRLRHRVLS